MTAFHKPPVFSSLYMPESWCCHMAHHLFWTAFPDRLPDFQVGVVFFLPTVVSWTWAAEMQKLGTESWHLKIRQGSGRLPHEKSTKDGEGSAFSHVPPRLASTPTPGKWNLWVIMRWMRPISFTVLRKTALESFAGKIAICHHVLLLLTCLTYSTVAAKWLVAGNTKPFLQTSLATFALHLFL